MVLVGCLVPIDDHFVCLRLEVVGSIPYLDRSANFLVGLLAIFGSVNNLLGSSSSFGDNSLIVRYTRTSLGIDLVHRAVSVFFSGLVS